jgi:regulator of cell morphogenesis and NO signaling
MSVTAAKTVGELALENPGATRLFETLGIDYCCGGGQTLEQACQAAQVSINQVTDSLAALSQSASATAPARNWQAAPLFELLAHIRTTHHVYTRAEIGRLGPLFDKVCSVHGRNHPELPRLRELFSALAEELTTHLMKEEMVLFPYILRLEEAVVAKEPVLPPPFGSVRNPIAMMMHEHDGAGSALRNMREISGGYAAPPDACGSFQTLYRALAAFEADLHQHIHLENNVLFPRAIAMERGH